MCQLESLPEEVGAGKLSGGGSESPDQSWKQGLVSAASTGLRSHPDALRPESIYKPWIFPLRQARLGLGKSVFMGLSPELYGAYVVDLPYLTKSLCPLPGRIAGEVLWSPWSVRQETGSPINNQAAYERTYGRFSLGARYERLLSNLFGYYLGVHGQWAGSQLERQNGSPILTSTPEQTGRVGAPHWGFQRYWFRGGLLFELPMTRGNVAMHLGGAFTDRGGLVLEFRTALGFLRHHGRANFGVRREGPARTARR